MSWPRLALSYSHWIHVLVTIELYPCPPFSYLFGVVEMIRVRVSKLNLILFRFIQIWSERTKQMLKGPMLVTKSFCTPCKALTRNPEGVRQCSQRTCGWGVSMEKWACSQPLCSSRSQWWSSFKHFACAFRRDQKRIKRNWTSLFINECWPSFFGPLKIWILNSKSPQGKWAEQLQMGGCICSVLSVVVTHIRPSIRTNGSVVPRGCVFLKQSVEREKARQTVLK